jgi:hypothetical protein
MYLTIMTLLTGYDAPNAICKSAQPNGQMRSASHPPQARAISAVGTSPATRTVASRERVCQSRLALRDCGHDAATITAAPTMGSATARSIEPETNYLAPNKRASRISQNIAAVKSTSLADYVVIRVILPFEALTTVDLHRRIQALSRLR